MKYHYLFDRTQPIRRKRFWVLAGFSALVTVINYLALEHGISVVFSHLFYFPIILAGYWYPRKGVVFSLCIAGLYGTMGLLLAPGPQETLPEITILSRCLIFIVIGAVVSYLSSNLRRSEQQLLDIIEFLPDATFAISTDGKVIAWNRAIEELTGIHKAEILGRGNYEYAVPFYGSRRPVLVDIILHPGLETAGLYQQIKKEARKFSAEIFVPHFHEGKGAHLRVSATALADTDGNITGGIEVIRDISDQVMLDSALQTTSSRLNILAGIVRNDIAKKLAVMYGHLAVGVMKFNDPDILAFISNIKESANAIQRQVEISREFRDIGTTPPAWIPVQQACLEAAERIDFKNVTFRSWTARLEFFTDPHIPTVFYHLFENSRKDGMGADRVIVSYYIHPRGCSILIEDNGRGISDAAKDSLFSKRSETYGCGLFLAHEILILTGIGIRETGTAGKGIRFEILIPPEGYRIANPRGVITAESRSGKVAYGSAMTAGPSGLPAGSGPTIRELMADEFILADEVWLDYREIKGDPALDRIFAVFLEGGIVSLARCRRHTDGMEIDGIFTLAEYRMKGYSRMAVGALVEACHNDDLFMHAVRHLVPFYTSFGFEAIAERDLPPTIRERYVWAAGNLEGAEVQPMRRKAGL